MSYQVPDSPLHPDANEEVHHLPEGTLDIDLNPDLEDEDEDEQEEREEEGGFVKVMPQSSNILLLNNQSESMQDQESNRGRIVTDQKEEGEEEEEEDINFPSITPTFENAYESTKSDFITHTQVSPAQQSKLVNYLDDELLQIQRKFVKAQSGEFKVLVNDIIEPLLSNLKVIWLSISPTSSNNIEYFLKIINDSEDYFQYFEFDGPSNKLVFEFLQYLDVKLSFLHDVKLLSPTQLVRLLSTINRLRLILIEKFSKKSNSIVELEVSKIFEGLLERT